MSAKPSSKKNTYTGRCRVCTHGRVGEIESLLAHGASLNDISASFDISRDAAHRHWTKHVPAKRRADLAGDGAAVHLPSIIAGPSEGALHRKTILLGTVNRHIRALDAAGSRNSSGLAQLIQVALKLENEIESAIEKAQQRGSTFDGSGTADDARLEELVLDELKDDPDMLARLSRRLRGDTVDATLLPSPGNPDQGAPEP